MNDKPFIKLLKSPLGWYFFDVNTQRIISVGKDVYDELSRILKCNDLEFKSTENKSIHQLMEQGYLSTKKPKKVEHPETKWLDYHYERNISKITLQLTQNCNLRCSYCIYSNESYNQRKHSNKAMSLEVAKKSVNYILNHSIDQDEINFSFYGGEPLLELHLMKKIVSYIKKEAHGRDYSFNITTNGTLLTEEVVDFFIENNIRVLISLDGPRDIHDESRKFACNGKGSYDVIINNINKAILKHPEFKEYITFNMVINPENDYDFIKSAINIGDDKTKIKTRSSMIDDVNSVERVTFSDDYRCKYNYNIFLAFLYKFGRLNKEHICSTTIEFLDNFDKKCKERVYFNELPDVIAPGGPCVPGQMRLFINVDGLFFPCERVSEISKSMNIGNISCGINVKKAKELLNIGAITEEKCSNCWALTMCSLCCKHADNGTKLDSKIKTSHCINELTGTSEFLLNQILVKEINNFK